MTDIEKMTETELFHAIAKIQGYDFVPRDKIKQWGWRYKGAFIDYESSPPDWPADIAAAFELIEEMRGLDGCIMLENGIRENFPKWYVQVWNCNDPNRDDSNYRPEAATVGNTAPLAICRAYLMWKQGEVT